MAKYGFEIRSEEGKLMQEYVDKFLKENNAKLAETCKYKRSNCYCYGGEERVTLNIIEIPNEFVLIITERIPIYNDLNTCHSWSRVYLTLCEREDSKLAKEFHSRAQIIAGGLEVALKALDEK